jgi:hypothetical protein
MNTEIVEALATTAERVIEVIGNYRLETDDKKRVDDLESVVLRARRQLEFELEPCG